MNTYDIDGVIYLGPGLVGVYPGPNDVIITGRSYEEAPETIKMLVSRGIDNRVLFNPIPFDEKTRESSGVHKARAIKGLVSSGYPVQIHFEDDPIQASIIRKEVPSVHVVLLDHDLVEKENVRHIDD